MNVLTKPDHILIAEVAALQAAYAAAIDDDRLEEWPEFFTTDGTYKVISRENADRGLEIATIYCSGRPMLIDRVVSLRQANIFPTHHYRHIISIPRICTVEDAVVCVETNYLVLQTRNDGVTTLYNAGKYVDHIRNSGAGLQFVSKVAIYDTSRVDTLMAKPI